MSVHNKTVDILCLDLIEGGISNSSSGRLHRANKFDILSVKDDISNSVSHKNDILYEL